MNRDPPRSGAASIPGNAIAFNGPGVNEIPYNPNEPYFNARQQVLLHDALTTDGVIPYDPKAPYFIARPQGGLTRIYYPIININPLHNAPRAIVDVDFFRTNANFLFPTSNASIPKNDRYPSVAQDELFIAQNYSVRPYVPQQPMVPVVAREAEQVVEAGRPGDRAELFAELSSLAETKMTKTMKTNWKLAYDQRASTHRH